MRRVRTAKVSRHAHDGAAARRGRGACEVPPLEIGVWAIQLSPYRAGLAGRHGTRLPVSPAFPTGSCPLWLSPSGQSMTQESPFELLLTASRSQHRVPRRTVSLHPAQASQRPCDGPVRSHTTCWLHDTTEKSMPSWGREHQWNTPPSFATPSVSIPPWSSCRDTVGKSARLRVG